MKMFQFYLDLPAADVLQACSFTRAKGYGRGDAYRNNASNRDSPSATVTGISGINRGDTKKGQPDRSSAPLPFLLSPYFFKSGSLYFQSFAPAA